MESAGSSLGHTATPFIFMHLALERTRLCLGRPAHCWEQLFHCDLSVQVKIYKFEPISCKAKLNDSLVSVSTEAILLQQVPS